MIWHSLKPKTKLETRIKSSSALIRKNRVFCKARDRLRLYFPKVFFVTAHGQPDWQYMEDYMKSIMDKSEQIINYLVIWTWSMYTILWKIISRDGQNVRVIIMPRFCPALVGFFKFFTIFGRMKKRRKLHTYNE